MLETRRERKESRESPTGVRASKRCPKKFDAIDGDNTVTQLGALVASIKGDNELLLALALLGEATLGGNPRIARRVRGAVLGLRVGSWK